MGCVSAKEEEILLNFHMKGNLINELM